MKAVVTTDGKIALPEELREQMGWVAGQVLELQAQGEKILIWNKNDDLFSKWRGRGHLPVGSTASEYLQIMRDGHRD